MALLTLAMVREKLWTFCDQKVPFVLATATQKADADFRINQVVERFLTDGKYRNTLRRITLPIVDEYITLPRELGTILGIKLKTDSGCCYVSQIYSKFHEFAHPTNMCCSDGTYPISETAQTFLVPTAPFTLRVKSTVAAGTISFYGGWDTNDDEYFGADIVSITNGTANGTRTYNSLPPTGGIQKSVTTVPVELYSVTGGVETLIAVYGPYEEVPAYKKYKVPDCAQFTSALVLGKLAYVPAVLDSDIIVPGVWGALRMGLKALKDEETDEDDHAAQNWATAYQILNGDLAELEGDNELPVFKTQGEFGCENIPNFV